MLRTGAEDRVGELEVNESSLALFFFQIALQQVVHKSMAGHAFVGQNNQWVSDRSPPVFEILLLRLAKEGIPMLFLVSAVEDRVSVHS